MSCYRYPYVWCELLKAPVNGHWRCVDVVGAGHHAACHHWVLSAAAGPPDVVVLTHLGAAGPVCVSGHGRPPLLPLLHQLLHLQQGQGQGRGWVQIRICIQIQTFCVFVVELEVTKMYLFGFEICIVNK